MQIDIQVSNRQLFGTVVFLIVLVGIGIAESYDSGTPSIMGLTWNEIDDIPADFADNMDNDMLGSRTCPIGQLLKYYSGNWLCRDDIYRRVQYGYRFYEMNSLCDIAYDGSDNGDVVNYQYCFFESTSATPPSGCIYIWDSTRTVAECSGSTRVCPTRTYYMYRCPNTPVGYMIS